MSEVADGARAPRLTPAGPVEDDTDQLWTLGRPDLWRILLSGDPETTRHAAARGNAGHYLTGHLRS